MSTDDWAIVATVPTTFEAELVLSTLRQAGVEAVAVETSSLAAGLRGGRAVGIAVQVRSEDLPRSRHVLDADAEDAREIDWETIEVGDRVDDLPLTPPGHVPLAARLAWLLAALLVGVVLVGSVVLILF